MGRYWRCGYWQKCPFYVKEAERGATGEDDGRPLMLISLDNNWWVVKPGFGDVETELLAQSDWRLKHPEAGHGLQDRQVFNEYIDLSKAMWLVPWDGTHCDAIVAGHGGSWMLQTLERQLSTEQNQSAALMSELKAFTDRALIAEAALDSQPRPTAPDRPPTVEHYEQDPGDIEEQSWKPKAGSMNHKCALIVAYKRGYWQEWNK